MYFIHGEPNELAGLPLWLGSKELFYFKNTVISFVCTWVGGRVGASSRRWVHAYVDTTVWQPNPRKLNVAFFFILKSFINCGGKKYCPNQKKKT